MMQAEDSASGLSLARRVDTVARMAVGVMTALLVVMLLRVAQLQLAPGEQLLDHSNTRVAHRTIDAPRGDLVDRRFRPLASSEFGYRVFVDPTELPSPPDEAIARLS
jgi:cell division protein FtsI/penicillin-binding protein 2